MPPFPPLFAYVFFGFLWLLEVILTLFVITIPASEVLAIFGDILIVFWLWLRLGPGLITKFRNPKANKKFIKRFLTQTFAEYVPIVNFFPWNIWFIYKQYKDEVAEYHTKVAKLDAKNADTLENNKQIEEGDKEIQAQIDQQKLQAKIQDEIESDNQVRDMRAVSNFANTSQWMTRNKRVSAGNPDLDRQINSAKRKEKEQKSKIKDIPDEMRLGEQLESPDSLMDKQVNYGKFDTYEAERKRLEEIKKQKIEEQKQKDKVVEIKVKQMTQAFAEQKAKEAEKKYGGSSNLVVRLKDRAKKNQDDQDGGDGLVGFEDEEGGDMSMAA